MFQTSVGPEDMEICATWAYAVSVDVSGDVGAETEDGNVVVTDGT